MTGTIRCTHKPTLTGDRVALRPLAVTDLPAVLTSLADEETQRLTGTHTRCTTDQVRQTIDRWSTQDDRIDMAVVAGRIAG